MKVKEFAKKYWEYILAFLIPVIVVLVHCIMRETWLFGGGSMLRGEAGTQYLYFFEELWNKVHGGDVSFFSWNALGGFDFYLNALYYAVSPATLIILLFPKSGIENALQFFMVLKWALMSFSAVYFFMNTKFNTIKKNRRFISLTLGVCYALSSFLIYSLTFINWLDTMILFPFLLLLIEDMVEKGSWRRFVWVLTVAICCNFYIAFPICVFLLLWFFIQLQTVETINKKVWITYFGSSVWAVISSMVVLLPCIVSAGNRYVLESGRDVSAYIRSVVELPDKLIGRFFILSSPDNMSEHGFDMYMSIGLVVLCLMFCFMKMNKKVKYSKMICTVFLVVSLCVGALNYMWHGFTIPSGYNLRFGFVFILLLAVMALDVMSHLEDLKLWKCLVMLAVGVGLFCYAFFRLTKFEEYYIYLIMILLFVFYFVLLVLLCRKSIKKETFLIVFCSLCLIEVSCNSYYQLSQYDMVYAEEEHEHEQEDEHEHETEQEIEHVEEVVEISENIPLETGKRVVYSNAGYNAGLRAGIPSMTGSISYSNDKMGKLLSNLGMSVLEDECNPYAGGTPLLNAMFNIGYGVGDYNAAFADSEQIEEGHELNIYKTDSSVGMGYMVQDTVVDWNADSDSAFVAQNSFVRMATGMGEENLFETFLPANMSCATTWGNIKTIEESEENGFVQYQYMAAMKEDGNVISFVADRDMDLYCTVEVSTGANIVVYVDGEITYRNLQSVGKMLLSIGKVKKGQSINIACFVKDEVGNDVIVSARFAELQDDVWQSVYEELSHNIYQITEMKSDYMDGKINVEESGMMMTAIPAMDGFTVYVDGEKTTYELVGDALIGVPLEKGEHRVEFRYQTPYAQLGWLLSLCSIGGLVIVCVIGRRKDATLFCEKGATE